MWKFLFFLLCAALLAGAGLATAQEAVDNRPAANSASSSAAVVDDPPAATTPAAVATPKPARHQAKTIQRRVPARSGPVRATASVNQPLYMKIQDIGIRENDGG
jgi:hypothetical protein